MINFKRIFAAIKDNLNEFFCSKHIPAEVERTEPTISEEVSTPKPKAKKRNKVKKPLVAEVAIPALDVPAPKNKPKKRKPKAKKV